MTAATTPSKSGKLSLIIAIAVFTAALVILLMTARSWQCDTNARGKSSRCSVHWNSQNSIGL